MTEGLIKPDDPTAPDVRQLLEVHLTFSSEHSPPEDVHALDIDGLLEPSISFFSYRVEGELLGFGALKHIDDGHAELKSMHTAVAARGRGVGRAMVDHLVAIARQRGYRRVSLETGTMEAFAPARAMYARAGFVLCPPFNGYWDSPYSVCMTLALAEEQP